MESKYIISIDMGGTKILTAAVNSTEGIVAQVKRPTKKASGNANFPKAISDSIDELIDTTVIEAEQITAVTLGIPGSVNPETGVVGLAPNLGLRNYHIKKELEQLLPYPVLIENDVNLAALGILHYGEARDLKNVLVVFVGTGIGAGLILNGQLYRGNSFTAGEIGHMHFIDEGPVCGCGLPGCYEAVASRTSVVRDIVRDIKSGKRSVLDKFVRNKIQIKSKALRMALEKGDKVAIKHMTNSAESTGKMLASINNLLNLDMIVLGGGVIEANRKFYMPGMKTAFKQFSLKDSARFTKVVATKLMDEAAIYGGIALAEEYLGLKV